MKRLLWIAALALFISACSNTPPSGAGSGTTNSGGGTMNDPTGDASSPAEADKNAAGIGVVEPGAGGQTISPGTSSGVGTATPSGGAAGTGTAAASPANPRGTGTGPTTP